MSDVFLRLLVLLAAVSQITVPLFLNPFRGGQNPVRASDPSQIEPAGYAFAIWGLIYVLAVVYALWQLTPAGRSDPVTARIAPLALTLYLGSSLWLASVQYGPLWATMPILAVMAASAIASLVMAAQGEQTLWRYLAVVAPFGFYAGWTACALFVNVAEVAPQYGFDRFGLSIPGYGVLSIAAATLLALAVIWFTRGEIAFAVTVVWALTAIVVAAAARGADLSVVAASGAGIVLVAAATIAARSWNSGGAGLLTK